MIYFIQAEGGGRIKIGTTIRLSERLKQLSGQYGCEFHVLGVIGGGRDEERGLHLRFAHLWAINEWFEPGDDLMGFIASEARQWDGFDEQPAGVPLRTRVSRSLKVFGPLLAENLYRLGY